MTEKRFHPFAVLHLLRKTILVYLLPLVQVLFARLIDEMIPKEPVVEKSTADTWKDRAKSLMKWVSQKGEDEQQ